MLAHEILDLDGRQHRVGLSRASSNATLPANDAAYRLRLVPAGDPQRPSTKPLARRRDRVPPSTLKLYEEFHPYGSSAYRAVDATIEVSAKRYRYTGKERDEETGLDHMGARYYAGWLGRWTAADPIGLGDGVNRYAYVRGNPVGMRDPSGTLAQGQDDQPRDVVVHSNRREELESRARDIRRDAAKLAEARRENQRALREALGPEGFANPDYDRDQVRALLDTSANIEYGERQIGERRAQLDKDRAELAEDEAVAKRFRTTEKAVNYAGLGALIGVGAAVAAPFVAAAAKGWFIASPTTFILVKEIASDVAQGEGGSLPSARTAKVVSQEVKAATTAERTVEDFLPEAARRVEEVKKQFPGAEGVVAMARKDDIKQIDRVVKEFGLNKDQRQLLHREITGQDLTLDEIRQIAEEIAKFSPKKGRNK